MKIKVTKNIPKNVAKNIFAILGILKEVGIPLEGLSPLRLQRMAQACMAIGGIKSPLKRSSLLRMVISLEQERFCYLKMNILKRIFLLVLMMI